MIANIKIFHMLLRASKLPSLQDVQHFLAYTIKIMEPSTKFTWCSETTMWNFTTYWLFTIIRGAIIPITSTRYYWRHCLQRPPLHELLMALVFLGIAGMGGPSFNRLRDCTLYECHFPYVCNRKVNGKACGQSYPSHTHP